MGVSRGQPLLSETIFEWRLSFFDHLCRADIGQDHSRDLRACIRGPPKDWRRRTGRPRLTWLRTVEDDLRPLNFGLATARRRAMDRPAWRLLVDAATSSWLAPERERGRTTPGPPLATLLSLCGKLTGLGYGFSDFIRTRKTFIENLLDPGFIVDR